MKKVYIVGESNHYPTQYGRMFLSEGWFLTDDINKADLVQFTGGEDVSPPLYGELPHPYTMSNLLRDMNEMEAWTVAKRIGTPCAGICRGGQFLNVMNGGKMLQHIEDGRHSGKHEAILNYQHELQSVIVSSTHHQMMLPAKSGTVLMYALSDAGQDTEAVLYPALSDLCFQPHPEFSNVEDCRKIYFDMIGRFLMPGRL
jgi:gamma-glutamyl-gamma-aminobutyrate hydrolase PuuD